MSDPLCVCHTAYACPVHPAEPAHDRAMEAGRDACAAMGRHSEPFATARVLADAAIGCYLRSLREQGATPKSYPYNDGDTIVLGPEIFVSADGAVICWRGENYVPQAIEPRRKGSP
jgi:hypothetical protein